MNGYSFWKGLEWVKLINKENTSWCIGDRITIDFQMDEQEGNGAFQIENGMSYLAYWDLNCIGITMRSYSCTENRNRVIILSYNPTLLS